MSLNTKIVAATMILLAMAMPFPVHAADAAFTQFIASLWPGLG